MALQKTTTTSQGFIATDAYHRVEGVTLASKTSINFRVRAYKEPGCEAFSDAGFACVYDISNANPFAQAYQFLKTLPEFSDATDC
jgi:hypothetical protein